MNGYKLLIRCAVYNNGKFTHNSDRCEIFHAENEADARKMAARTLKGDCVHNLGYHKIEISSEYVAHVDDLGRVEYVTQVHYVKETGCGN